MRGALRARCLAIALPIAMFSTLAFAEPGDRAVATASGAALALVRVQTIGCPRLRSDRVEQLLRLELATLVPVVSELPTLDVDFLCVDGSVRITLKDPVTVKVVTRDVSLGASADPERTLALAASELFLASWAELLIPRPEDTARASDPAVVAAKQAVERVVPAHPSIAVDLGAIGRERHIAAPILTLGVSLRVSLASCAKPQIFADAGWETGSAPRSSGRVDVSATAVGMGARWCLRFAFAELGVSGTVSVAYIALQGVSFSPAFYGARHDGFTAEASGGIDANLTLRAVRFGAAFLVGALAPGPVGNVVGGTAVRVDGPWAGAVLFAGLLL